MGLFKKKKDVPDLPLSPSLPSLPAIPEEPAKKDLPELPSFPTTPKDKDSNQEIVKSAVSDVQPSGEKEVGAQAPEGLHEIEEPKKESMIPPKPPVQTPPIESPIPEPPATPKMLEPQEPEPQKIQAPIVASSTEELSAKPSNHNEPIFVRIDKFQAAQKNFENIKSKLTKIESTLKKIEDVRLQEEEEIKEWTENIEKLKSRLMEIDGDIFGQL